jgi:hypothetical protein
MSARGSSFSPADGAIADSKKMSFGIITFVITWVNLAPLAAWFDYGARLRENEGDVTVSGVVPPQSGPVAQLGARFHGMEEVVGSIPTRSTIFNNLQIPSLVVW